ncbi:MAG TPA: anhydro-N-acetylmuramic acid kinase [Phycisphaerales bacterium]|nr:anhydro-N-acetylmuramic acid kinase [Phycisphaerales bacterium]
MPDTARLVVGCMTGTSIDALDVAIVRLRGTGLGMAAEFVRGHSVELGALGPRLRALADQHATTAGEIAGLSREFALLHASAIRETLGGPPGGPPLRGGFPDLVCVHGQTIFHAPPVSWQMFNGAALAHELGTPVVFDLRAADLASGGQGAPITPLADWVFFRSSQPRAIVNLGGFCNATLLPADDGSPAAAQIDRIEGFDVCACNHVLDRIARETMGTPFDADGARAIAGTASAEAVGELRDALASQSRAGRSLGTGDETGRWVDRWKATLPPNDLAASACAAIGSAIAARISGASGALIAGGGARNRALTNAIAATFRGPVESTAATGLPIEFREAAAMGVLGALCADGVPITLPRVTGVKPPAPVAGVWAGIAPSQSRP